MNRSVDYDAIAEVYDHRYERSDYSPVLRLLLSFVHGGRRILEVGCGTGHWLQELTKHGYDVVGLDPSRKMLQAVACKSRQPLTVQGCAEAMPWRQKMLDRIFCINAFHHFANQEGFLAEARRVLRHGGGILVVGLDPHTGLDRWWIYDYFPQVIDISKKRYPSTDRIRSLMAAYGFVSSSTMEALHMPLRISARLALETGRLAKTTTSQLAVLTDDEYSEGMTNLMRDIEINEAQHKVLTIGADWRLYATSAWLR